MNPEKYIETITYYLSTYALKVLAALIVFLVGKWIARKISNVLARVMEARKVDVTLIGFMETLTYYALVVMVIIAAASQLGINTTSFLTVVGAAGLAVGLALKDSLANFASGIMLIFFRPFRVGDFIKTCGVAGSVHSISIFNTILNTPDNQRVILPNSNITGDVITNITANDTRRIDMVIGIGYGDDIKKAKNVLMDLVTSDPRIMEEPEPMIAVSELADSSINFVVRPWVKTVEYWDVRFDLTEKIKTTFDREGISIPFPQQDVHIISQEK